MSASADVNCKTAAISLAAALLIFNFLSGPKFFARYSDDHCHVVRVDGCPGFNHLADDGCSILLHPAAAP